MDPESVRTLWKQRLSLWAIARATGLSTSVVRRVVALREGEP